MPVRQRILIALAASALFTLFLALAAGAMNGTGFTLDDAHTHVFSKYGALPVNNPSGNVQDPTLSQCQSDLTMAAIPITIRLKSPSTATETISTGWDYTTNDDIDVYFFQDSDGTEIAKATSGSTTTPEVLNLALLPNAKYWLCVLNSQGVNTGFTVDARVTYLDLYHYTPPPATPVPSSPPPGSAAPPPTPLPAIVNAGQTTPSVAPEVVATPGPNGPITGQQLDALSASEQASAHKQGHSALSIALGAATILIAASGAGVVILRIRRDTA